MRKFRGFTLIELLVVIGVIAVLLAILMPALNRARELAQRAVCANLLKSITISNEMYASKYDGYYAPVRAANMKDDGATINRTEWWRNQAYRECLGIKGYVTTEDEEEGLTAPPEFLCPADKISKDPGNVSYGSVLLSYGYNYTEFGSWSTPYNPPAYTGKPQKGNIPAKYVLVCGLKSESVKRASEKLAFIDSVDWWVQWVSGDYTGVHHPYGVAGAGWDNVGQQTAYRYGQYGLWGPVIYRHNEGANIGFYDGHVAYMKKQDIFVADDITASPCRPGMWVVDIGLFNSNGCPYVH